MFLVHLLFIKNFIPAGAASVFTVASRCVAPMLGYFAVEGIFHTHNIKKYCLRLSVLASVMFAGNAVLNTIFKMFSRTLSDSGRKGLYIDANVIFTLAIGVIAISIIQWAKGKQAAARVGIYLVSVILFIIGFLWGEWGTVLLPFMFIRYFFHNKLVFRMIGYVLIEVIAVLLPFSEPLWFIALPFLLLYNGKRGPNTGFSKYFFYIFYPLHIWIIAIINFMDSI